MCGALICCFFVFTDFDSFIAVERPKSHVKFSVFALHAIRTSVLLYPQLAKSVWVGMAVPFVVTGRLSRERKRKACASCSPKNATFDQMVRNDRYTFKIHTLNASLEVKLHASLSEFFSFILYFNH